MKELAVSHLADDEAFKMEAWFTAMNYVNKEGNLTNESIFN